MTLPIWPTLSRANRFYDRKERHVDEESNDEEYYAWENTSVLIASMRRDVWWPCLLSAGYSFPVIHCGGVRHEEMSMYFDEPPASIRCLNAGERFWYFPYVDRLSDSKRSHEIGLITNESEVTWLVLHRI
jgi:hypothetical protein